MRLARIAECSRRVMESSSRNEKVALLAECLRELGTREQRCGVAYLSGELPQGKIGVGYAAVRAVSAPPAGEASLEVRGVDRELDRIAAMSGKGSQAARLAALQSLLARATDDEQRLLRQLLTGELRQGALEGVMVAAIAKAAQVPLDGVRRAVMLCGDLGAVAEAALREGAAGLGRFALQLFRPLQPMLAQTAGGVGSALETLGRAAFEWKLDGARIQAHKGDGEVRVFTRQLNDVTAAVPEVVEAVRALPARSIVLDGEAIALRPDGTPRPFQETMRRFGRKLDVHALQAELPLAPYFFDCLHVDGQDLIDRTSEERVAAMSVALPPEIVVPRLVTADEEEGDAFFDAALARGHEGVVAKSLASPYEAGRRGAGWLKIKPAHTLDLVVLACEWGSGRREGWLSNLHLGARDPASGGFVMLGKTFKGLSDELLEWQTRRFLELEAARDEYTVYLRPEQVVEIAFDGVQTSPHYPGGLALRFARVKRYRPDKSASEADTLDRVRAIHAGERSAR